MADLECLCLEKGLLPQRGDRRLAILSSHTRERLLLKGSQVSGAGGLLVAQALTLMQLLPRVPRKTVFHMRSLLRFSFKGDRAHTVAVSMTMVS